MIANFINFSFPFISRIDQHGGPKSLGERRGPTYPLSSQHGAHVESGGERGTGTDGSRGTVSGRGTPVPVLYLREGHVPRKYGLMWIDSLLLFFLINKNK